MASPGAGGLFIVALCSLPLSIHNVFSYASNTALFGQSASAQCIFSRTSEHPVFLGPFPIRSETCPFLHLSLRHV